MCDEFIPLSEAVLYCKRVREGEVGVERERVCV